MFCEYWKYRPRLAKWTTANAQAGQQQKRLLDDHAERQAGLNERDIWAKAGSSDWALRQLLDLV